MSAAGFAYKPVAEDAGADAKKTENPPKSPHIIYTIPVSRTFIRFLGLAAAAVILFLLISIPVKEVDKASYSASFVPQEVMPKKTVDEIVSDAFSATGMGALGNAVNPVDPGLLDSDGYVASPSGGGVAKTSATELPASGGGVSKTPLTESRVSGGGVAKTSATESPASGGGVSKTSATESPASSGGAVTKTPEPEVNAGAKASKAAVGESSSSAKSSTGKKAASALPANTVSKNDSGKYYVIIGSFDTHGRAKAYINRLKGEVAANVGILERDGKIRVYAQQFSTRKSAHSYLNKIRQHTEHKQAWLYEKP
jgi:cell division septation protein DedD